MRTTSKTFAALLLALLMLVSEWNPSVVKAGHGPTVIEARFRLFANLRNLFSFRRQNQDRQNERQRQKPNSHDPEEFEEPEDPPRQGSRKRRYLEDWEEEEQAERRPSRDPKRAEQDRYNEILIAAVQELGRSADDVADPKLCAKVAEPKVRDLARIGKGIDHDGATERIIRLGGAENAATGGEIVAMSTSAEPEQAAADCVSGWKKSRRHNAWMQPPQDLACYAMARSDRGAFYCLGVFSNPSKRHTYADSRPIARRPSAVRRSPLR